MAFSRKAFINFLLPIIGLLLVAGALFFAFPSAAAYASCNPGATCDSAGQTCTYFLPTDTICTSTLTCNSYNQSQTRSVPYNTACFCMQNLEITQVTDQSLAGNGAEAVFKIRVRESNQVNYRLETTYTNLLTFGSASSTTCDECRYNSDCDSDEYCDDGECRSDYNRCDFYERWNGNRCVLRSGYCYSSGDCGGNEYCSNHVCRYDSYYYDYLCGTNQHWNGYQCVYDWNYNYDSCYDTDGGYDYAERGTASNGYTSYTDSCSGDYLYEGYCDSSGNVAYTTHYCSNGCYNGRCYSDSSPSTGSTSPQTLSEKCPNGASEQICGRACSDYYYIGSSCRSAVKTYCERYGIRDPELTLVQPCTGGVGSSDACQVSGHYAHGTLQIGATSNQGCARDPPVDCTAHLTGPGLTRTYIGAYPFDVLPNLEYSGVVRINQSYFGQQGTYSLDVACNIQLPNNSVACSAGCSSAGATLNFHVDTCNTAISVTTDKVQYASGDVMTIRGTLRNNNLPIGTTVYVRIQDASGNVQATIPVSASGGEFSTNWIVPNTLSTGSYRINASAKFNACAMATSDVTVGIASCDVTVSSTFTQHGSASPATVTGTVYNHGTSLSGANVTVKVYKDGSLYKQGYVGSTLDGTYAISLPGTYSTGTYSAVVEAKYLTCPAVSSTASSSSTISFEGACDIKLMGGAARFSSTVSGVQVTGYLADSAGTRARGTYTIEVRNKAGSVIGSTTGTTASSGDISATVANVPAGDYDVVVKSTSGSCTATDKLSLGGDFQVSLISSPACGSASSVYQILLKNTQSSQMTVTMAYSSASQVTLSGPASVVLPASGEAVISVTVGFADTVSGGSLGVVSFNNSNAASSQSLQLPICASGNLRVNIVDKLRSGSIGQRVCYNFQVENRGAESGTVTLSYDSGPYYVDGSFSLQQFRLSSYETRDDLQFCATVPNSQFYTLPIVLRATAPFSVATDTVAMSSGASNTDISIGFSGCPLISKGVQYPISLYNNGETANYAFEITDNGYLHPLVMPQVVYNFARYSNQIITVSVDPTGLLSANYVTLYIRKDGAIVKQQQLCFATIGTTNASSQYSSSLYPTNRSALSQQASNAPNVTIYAPQINYVYNGTHFVANASFLVKNNENRSLLYEANVNLPQGWAASYYPRAATIRPGYMGEFTVELSAENFQKRAYSASIAIVDPIGRTASAPFSIDATKAESAGILTGFFSAAGTTGYGAAIVVLLAIGGVLFYGIRKQQETAA